MQFRWQTEYDDWAMMRWWEAYRSARSAGRCHSGAVNDAEAALEVLEKRWEHNLVILENAEERDDSGLEGRDGEAV